MLHLVCDSGHAGQPTLPSNSTARTSASRPTAARRSRLHRAALSSVARAGERLEAAAHRRRPRSLLTEQERAAERLAAAQRASAVREPATKTERVAARLEAAARRGRRRPCMGAQEVATGGCRRQRGSASAAPG